MSKPANRLVRLNIRTQPEEVKMLKALQKYLTPRIGYQNISAIYRTCLMKFGPKWIEAEYGKPFEEVINLKA